METYLETDTGNITDSVTLTAETGNEHLVVLLNVVEATVTRHKSGNLLAVLDQLHTDALANGRVGLLGLNTKLLDNNALGVRGASKRVGLKGRTQVGLLVAKVAPLLCATVLAQVTCGTNSTRLTHL